MSWRATSPSDQPAYRPKLRTVPDGRPGGGPAAPNPSAARIESSKPPPTVERPDVQSRETVSGGRVAAGWAAGGAAGRAAGEPDPRGVPGALGDAPADARVRSYARRLAGSPISSHAAL